MVAITTTVQPTTVPNRPSGPGTRPRLHLVPDAAVVRRRLLAGFVAAVLVAVVVVAFGYLATAAPDVAGSAPTLADHVVVEGETMWSIAQELAPAGEAGTYVERLVDANGGAEVRAGEVLTVPVP